MPALRTLPRLFVSPMNDASVDVLRFSFRSYNDAPGTRSNKIGMQNPVEEAMAPPMEKLVILPGDSYRPFAGQASIYPYVNSFARFRNRRSPARTGTIPEVPLGNRSVRCNRGHCCRPRDRVKNICASGAITTMRPPEASASSDLYSSASVSSSSSGSSRLSSARLGATPPLSPTFSRIWWSRFVMISGFCLRNSRAFSRP